jgi:integrase
MEMGLKWLFWAVFCCDSIYCFLRNLSVYLLVLGKYYGKYFGMSKAESGAGFRVVPFENPSGEVVFRVEGRLNGKRIRRNFRSEPLAKAEAERLSIEAAAVEGSRRVVSTTLTANQVRIAELLFESAGSDDDVLAMVGSVSGRRGSVPLIRARTAFLTELEHGGCRDVTLNVHRDVLGAFFRMVEGDSTDDLSEAAVRAFVFDAELSARSRVDRRQRIGQFLKFCISKGWVVRNWAADLPQIKVERGLPEILSVDDLAELMTAARENVRSHRSGKPRQDSKGMMLGYFLCTAFSGLRPTEARRVLAKDFHLDGELDCIEVSARIAKVSQCRQVEVLPELRPHLEAVLKTAKRRRVEPMYFVSRQFNNIRREAGVVDLWCNDILRHTYASWHYALFKDIDRLAYTMGNSKQVLFQNYIRPMNARTARRYLEVLHRF